MRRAENIANSEDAEEREAAIRELLRPLENAAHLVIWDMLGEVETAKPGDLRFHIPNRDLPYEGQLLIHEREQFVILLHFPTD